MTIAMTIAWWWIPTIITVSALCWALFVVDGGDGYMSGIANLIALVPALGVSCISWIIGAIFK